jgi:hypothetical protein
LEPQSAVLAAREDAKKHGTEGRSIMRFNPPPQWPVPRQGWFPNRDWTPDPSWPPAPPGWRFFIDEPTPDNTIVDDPPRPELDVTAGSTVFAAQRPTARPKRVWLLVTIVAVVGLVGILGYVYHRVNAPDVIVLDPVDAQGNLQSQSGWVQDNSRADEHIDCSFGSPSRYDKTAGVRSCGGTADSGDACWPATDGNHVLCLTDPFSNVLYLVGTQGLSTPRKSSTEDPTPFALVLDDGTQCQARIGGSWPSPKEHPDWVGYYGCRDPAAGSLGGDSLNAVWGPRGEGIKKGFGGWTVEVGTEDGHLTTHKVTKAYYVGVATPGGTESDSRTGGPGGTRLVTKCGHPPEFKPETIQTDSGALVIRMKIVAHCPSGDVLTSPTTRVTVTSGGQNIASGMFDLSAQPIVIAPGSGGNDPEPAVEHDFRFPVGTFWRLPVSTREAPTNGASQQGDVDLDAKTLLVDCDQSGSAKSSAQSSDSPATASTAAGPAQPETGDSESASYDALRAIANADRPFVTSTLADRWVPQLSSKRPGLVADGITWNNSETLREHLQLRLTYPEVRLLWSGDWSTFSATDFWVTIAGVTFADADGALGWCRGHNLDRDHCYAKLVSTTHPIDASTAFNP